MQEQEKIKVLNASTITKEEEAMHSKDPRWSNSILLQVKKIMELCSKSSVEH